MITVFFADSDSIGSKLVRLMTRGEWAHCGLYDPVTGTVIDSLASCGGVTEYAVEHLHAHFDRVAFVPIPYPRVAYDFARSQIGKPYDFTALLWWLFPFRRWQDKDKWYCSELVAAALSAAAGQELYFDTKHGVSPDDLFRKLRFFP
jgi:uncharacterized protein YycO